MEHSIPELSIHYGSFQVNKKWLPLTNPIGNIRFVEVLKTEEKGSDVNLAVHLVNDIWKIHIPALILANSKNKKVKS